MYNQVNVQHIKNYFKKPSVLILAILTFAAVIIPYFAMIPLFSCVADIDSIAELFGDEFLEWNTIFSDYSYTSSFIGTFISSILSIAVSSLPAVAWFIINLNSKKNNSQPPNAGFMILFILSIVGIVGASFIILYSGILFLLGIFGLGVTRFPALSFLFFLLGLIMFLVGIFELIYNILGLKFYSGVRRSTKSTNMVVTGKSFGVFSIITSILGFLASVFVVVLLFLIFEVIKNSETYEGSIIFNMLSYKFVIICIIILISSILSLVSGIILGNVAIGYADMAQAVPVTPEPPVYINYNNQYNQGYGYPQQTPVNNMNNNYNGGQNTYSQQQYNQNYYSNPQPTFQQQNDEQVDVEQNPYQQ